MNSELFRRKRVLLPTLAVTAALAVGGTTWAASANDVTGADRDRIAAAAVKIVGGGTAEEVEYSDDPGEAYEVEIRRADGTEVEISLDKNLKEVRRDTDNDRDDNDDNGPDNDDNGRDVDDDNDDNGRDNDDDADERRLSASERSSAGKAAVKAVGGGTATDIESSDDPGTAYEVEVRTKDGVEWDVDLDKSFAVVSKKKDD